jgi:hypothetical protein
MWGEPKSDILMAAATGSVTGAVTPAPVDGVPYRNPRDKRCIANDDTCMGWATNGSAYCAGHARRITAGTHIEGS